VHHRGHCHDTTNSSHRADILYRTKLDVVCSSLFSVTRSRPGLTTQILPVECHVEGYRLPARDTKE
jgi:hypothetical protein